MKFRAILAAAVVLAMATSAQAISLVVMATNTTAIPGEKVFTIGVKVTAADVAAAGPNSNAVLVVQNVTFTGGATGPIHASGAGNQPDVSGVQSNFINSSAINNGGPPSASLGTSGNNAFYKDSWWYNSAGGTLQGINDSSGDTGTVTTAPPATAAVSIPSVKPVMARRLGHGCRRRHRLPVPECRLAGLQCPPMPPRVRP